MIKLEIGSAVMAVEASVGRTYFGKAGAMVALVVCEAPDAFTLGADEHYAIMIDRPELAFVCMAVDGVDARGRSKVAVYQVAIDQATGWGRGAKVGTWRSIRPTVAERGLEQHKW